LFLLELCQIPTNFYVRQLQTGLEKNHDFFEKIEKIDLIDDLIDEHI